MPPYSRDKVIELTNRIISEEDTSGSGDNSFERMDKKNYSSLSLSEKFTYNMIHPEYYSQNCSILPLRIDEANRIYGELPDIFDEFSWSERQINFFKDNRDSVEELMKAIITKNNVVGPNFLKAIIEMQGKEMIPFLIDAYKIKKDHYILTTFMLLMKEYEYPEFMQSPSYKKLYKSGEAYSSFLVYNQANEDLIIKRATDFYNASANK